MIYRIITYHLYFANSKQRDHLMVFKRSRLNVDLSCYLEFDEYKY